ncbi:ankyrin repeat-containing domain protein [Baffinella frigidus]|nr:ankyrin repeat-containing domain protein [Cryptophyta sp. CCMP2293]
MAANRSYFPTTIGRGFDGVVCAVKRSSCLDLGHAIDMWLRSPGARKFYFGGAMPTELADRVLLSICRTSCKDGSRKVHMMINKYAADPNAFEPPGLGRVVQKALAIALFHQRDEVAIALLELNADPNLVLNSSGHHPLVNAAAKSTIKLLQSLHTHGADMTKTNAWGDSMGMMAVSKGRVDVVRFLVERVGVDPSEKRAVTPDTRTLAVPPIISTWCDVNRSLLHTAVDLKNRASVDMVDFLINAGADVHHRGDFPNKSVAGTTPMGYNALQLLTDNHHQQVVSNPTDDLVSMAKVVDLIEDKMRDNVATWHLALGMATHPRLGCASMLNTITEPGIFEMIMGFVIPEKFDPAFEHIPTAPVREWVAGGGMVRN